MISCGFYKGRLIKLHFRKLLTMPSTLRFFAIVILYLLHFLQSGAIVKESFQRRIKT